MATPTGTTPNSSSKRPAGTVTTPSHLSHTSPAPRSVPSPATARAHTAGKTPTSSSQASKTLAGSSGSGGGGGSTPMMRNLSQTTSNASPSAAAAAAAAAAAGAGAGHHSTGGAHHLPVTPSLVPGSAGGTSGVGSAGPGSAPMMGPSLSEMGLSLSMSRSLSSSGGGGLGAGLGITAGSGAVVGGVGGVGVGGAPHGGTGVAHHRLGGPANEDSLRRARMRRVLGGLARPAGRVSEEGIARVARRVGFAIDLDDGVVGSTTAAEAEARVGNRTITVAGNTVMIELDLKSNVPRSVNVAVNGGGEAMRAEEKRAGQVLLQGLKVSQQSGGGVCGEGLGRFANDLEALARIDRLSSQQISCFEALSGIYGCLRRLWSFELKATKEELEKSGSSKCRGSLREDLDERVEALVKSKKSGMPSAHSRGRIGWELVYWQTGSRGLKKRRPKHTKPNNDDMDVDGGEPKADDSSDIDDPDNGTTYSLLLETESSPAGLYPSLRISDAWLPENIDLPSPDSADGLPWQDPAPTFLASDDDNTDAMAVDGGPDHHQKLPDLRFVARLDPPLVMPYPIAAQILASVGLPAPPMMTLPPQYAASAIDPTASAPAQPGTFSQSAKQTVLSMAHGHESLETHVYTLDTAKPDWSYTLHEIPFSHPRQIIDLLPTLRQWAQVGTLLRQALVGESVASLDSKRPEQPAEQHQSATLSLSSLTTAPSPREADVEMTDDSSIFPVNILLNTAPVPTFKFTFPASSSSAREFSSLAQRSKQQHRELTNVTMQVLANAELAVVAYDGLNLPATKAKGADGQGKSGDDGDRKEQDRESEPKGKEEQQQGDEGSNGDQKSSASNDAGEPNAQEAVDKENGRLKQKHDVQKRLARALAVCGDCRVWVEWMRGMARL